MGADNTERTAYVRPGDRVRMLVDAHWWKAGDEALVMTKRGQADFNRNKHVEGNGIWYVSTETADPSAGLYKLEILERGCKVPPSDIFK